MPAPVPAALASRIALVRQRELDAVADRFRSSLDPVVLLGQYAPKYFPTYVTATRPPAGPAWGGRLIIIADPNTPARLQGCLPNGAGAYAWVELAIEPPDPWWRGVFVGASKASAPGGEASFLRHDLWLAGGKKGYWGFVADGTSAAQSASAAAVPAAGLGTPGQATAASSSMPGASAAAAAAPAAGLGTPGTAAAAATQGGTGSTLSAEVAVAASQATAAFSAPTAFAPNAAIVVATGGVSDDGTQPGDISVGAVDSAGNQFFGSIFGRDASAVASSRAYAKNGTAAIQHANGVSQSTTDEEKAADSAGVVGNWAVGSAVNFYRTSGTTTRRINVLALANGGATRCLTQAGRTTTGDLDFDLGGMTDCAFALVVATDTASGGARMSIGLVDMTLGQFVAGYYSNAVIPTVAAGFQNTGSCLALGDAGGVGAAPTILAHASVIGDLTGGKGGLRITYDAAGAAHTVSVYGMNKVSSKVGTSTTSNTANATHDAIAGFTPKAGLFLQGGIAALGANLFANADMRVGLTDATPTQRGAWTYDLNAQNPSAAQGAVTGSLLRSGRNSDVLLVQSVLSNGFRTYEYYACAVAAYGWAILG